MNETGDANGNNDAQNGVAPREATPHYHGDSTRVLFMLSAILIIIAQSTGADLPISTFGAVLAAVALVIAAGITSPTQTRIHWVNAGIAAMGALIFGISAVTHYRQGTAFFDPSFVYTEALAILSLIALYFTTRTIRGLGLKSFIN